MRVHRAFNRAMKDSAGVFRVAAAQLAEELDYDEELREEAATLLIALLLAPGWGEHERVFKMDTGRTVAEFVQKHQPNHKRT